MNVLLLTPYFLPEEPPISFLMFELAKGLSRAGHVVEVVTGFPSWPVDKVYAEYKKVRFQKESYKGVSVTRLPYLKGRHNTLISKAFGYVHFRIMVWLYRKKFSQPDVIYAPIPSNETGMAALQLSRYFGRPYVLNVQDIHPDAFINLGILKNPLAIKVLRKQEAAMYRDATRIVVIGELFRGNLQSKGIVNQIDVIPNWINVSEFMRAESASTFRKEFGIPESGFVILYAGTFGRVHGVEVILDAAKRTSSADIVFLMVGQGFDFEKCKARVERERLVNVIVKPFVPRERLPELQSTADVSLVTMLPGQGFSSIPSKILGYMAAGKPVIALAEEDCETSKLIQHAQCGIVIPTGDSIQLLQAIEKLRLDSFACKRFGLNARAYVSKFLDKDILVKKVINVLFEAATANNK